MRNFQSFVFTTLYIEECNNQPLEQNEHKIYIITDIERIMLVVPWEKQLKKQKMYLQSSQIVFSSFLCPRETIHFLLLLTKSKLNMFILNIIYLQKQHKFIIQ